MQPESSLERRRATAAALAAWSCLLLLDAFPDRSAAAHHSATAPAGPKTTTSPGGPVNTSAEDLAALRALNKRFIHNFVTNDVASHDAILHPQFRSITPQGAHVDRVAYLKYWASGFNASVITDWDMRDERITLIADIALVSATNKWTKVTPEGAKTGMTCYTDTYVRHDGRWLCVLAHLTTVSPEHYPPDSSIVVRYVNGQLQPQT